MSLPFEKNNYLGMKNYDGGMIKMNTRGLSDWERLILSDEADLIPGKSQILYEKAEKYKEACEILKALSDEGLLSFEAENPLKPYFLHCIWIKWNYKEGILEVPTVTISNVISKMDTVLWEEGIDGEWQLSSKLYVMTE